MTVSILKRF